MKPPNTLIVRLQHQVATLAAAVTELNLGEVEFDDWFDATLFHPSAQQPLDYIKQIERNLVRLQVSEVAADQLWLVHRLSDQISALYRALGYFRGNTSASS